MASTSTAVPVSAQELQLASKQYDEGVQHLRVRLLCLCFHSTFCTFQQRLTMVVMTQGNDLEKAVELLGQALQTRISAYGGDAVRDRGPIQCYCTLHWQRWLAGGQPMHSGLLLRLIRFPTCCAELAEECGTCYHRYGAALFYRAQEESDVFGATLQQAARAKAGPDGGAGPSAPAAAGRAEKDKAPATTAGPAPGMPTACHDSLGHQHHCRRPLEHRHESWHDVLA